MMYYENIQQAMGVDIAISTEMAQRILLWNKMKHHGLTQAWMF